MRSTICYTSTTGQCLAQLENDKTFMSHATLQVAFTTCISKYKCSKRCPSLSDGYKYLQLPTTNNVSNLAGSIIDGHRLIGSWLSIDYSTVRISELPLKTPRDQVLIYASTLVQGTDCTINLHVFDRGGNWRTWRKSAWHRENM